MSDHLFWVSILFTLASVLSAWLAFNLVGMLFVRYQTSFQASTGYRVNEMFMSIDPRALFLLNLVLMALAGLLIWMLTRNLLTCLVVLCAIGLAPRLVWRYFRARRLQKLESQLPDALMSISGAMKAGLGMTAAMSQVVEESKGPFGQEFGLVLRHQKLGVPLEEAFARLLKRASTPALVLVVSALRIALQTGGGLAETLEITASTLRAKAQIEGKIDALTSQGRLQMWVVGLLPFVLLLALHYLEPQSMAQLWTTHLGWATLTSIGILEFLGVWMIRRICAIDV